MDLISDTTPEDVTKNLDDLLARTVLGVELRLGRKLTDEERLGIGMDIWDMALGAEKDVQDASCHGTKDGPRGVF